MGPADGGRLMGAASWVPPGRGRLMGPVRAAVMGVVGRSPGAATLAAASLGALLGLDGAWARPAALGPVLLLGLIGVGAVCASLAVPQTGLMLGGLVALAAASAVADLPVGRAGAGTAAAMAGGLLVVAAEAVEWVATARAGGVRRGHPAGLRVIAVGAMACAGGAVGAGAFELRQVLGGLGLGAVVLGAIGAIGCVAVVAALARADAG